MLWLERAYSRLGLPFWLGAVITSLAIPFALEELDSYLANLDLVPTVVNSVIILVLFFYLQWGARFACRKMERLQEYAGSLASEDVSKVLKSLYSGRAVLVTWLLVAAILLPTSFEGGVSLTAIAKAHVVPATYSYLIFAFFLWVYGYSMLSIYRMGKLPLNLKSFAEDKTLGLKPFGAASLRLTALYEVPLVLLTIPDVADNRLVVVTQDVSLMLLGLALFLLPLLSLRNKLVQVKTRELGWISPLYVRIVQKMKSENNPQIDEKLARDLGVIDKIQRDIHQIRTWPFDAGIIARLLSLTILPVTLTVLARLLIILTLHV